MPNSDQDECALCNDHIILEYGAFVCGEHMRCRICNGYLGDRESSYCSQACINIRTEINAQKRARKRARKQARLIENTK